MTWESRIVGYGDAVVDQIVANESNWRIHPKPQQDAMGGVLDEVGWIQNVIINKRTHKDWPKGQRGVEALLDGHMRVQLCMGNGQKTVPVTYVDLTPNEEAIALATYDPIGAMAAADRDMLNQLMQEIQTESESLQHTLATIGGENDVDAEWTGMPEFEHEDKTGYQSIHIHFTNQRDVDKFAKLIGQAVTANTRSLWYPKAEIGSYSEKRYTDES